MRNGLCVLPWLFMLALAGCNNGTPDPSNRSTPAAPGAAEATADAGNGAPLAPAVAPALAAPAGLTATAGNGQVTLAWNPAAGAASYAVYWSATPGAGTAGTRIADATSPFTHERLINLSTYTYVVTAQSAGEESPPSDEVSATPAPLPAPTGVSANAGHTQATVSWNPVQGATGYRVYTSLVSGAGTTGMQSPVGVSPYVQAGLTDGMAYYFVVTAVGPNGESLASAEVSATPGIPAGVLDVTFNGTGFATFAVASAIANSQEQGIAVVTDKSNRPVMLSSAAYAGVSYQAMSRWTAAGLADLSFGKSPNFSLEPDAPGAINLAGGVGASPIALAQDSAGRQYAVGDVVDANGWHHLALWRYAPGARDGQNDPSFGAGTGVVLVGSPLGGNAAAGLAVAVDSLGRIVVGGYSTNPQNDAYATVWRFNSDGTPDVTFGANGDGVSIQTIYGPYGTASALPTASLGGYATPGDSISSLAIDRENRIVILGHTQDPAGNWGLFLARLTAGVPGAPATGGLSDNRGFGWAYNYTLVFNTLGGNYDWGTAVAQSADGTRQIVAGYSWNLTTTTYFMTVWAFANNGSFDGILDPAFGTAGHSSRFGSAGGTQGEYGFAVALDGQNRIVVAGQSTTPAGGGVTTVWRMLSNGAPDSAFTNESSTQPGAVWLPSAAGGSYDVGLGLALDGRGRIVVSGYSYTASNQGYVAVLWRLMP